MEATEQDISSKLFTLESMYGDAEEELATDFIPDLANQMREWLDEVCDDVA